MPDNPRMQIIEEMMQAFVQSVSAERVAVFYKRVSDIPEDLLRAACVGVVESGQQRGTPTVAEVRRRANELTRGRLGEPVAVPKDREENREFVERLRGWNFCEHEISEILDGQRLVAAGPKRFRFVDRALHNMEYMAAKLGSSLSEMGISLPIGIEPAQGTAAEEPEYEDLF